MLRLTISRHSVAVTMAVLATGTCARITDAVGAFPGRLVIADGTIVKALALDGQTELWHRDVGFAPDGVVVALDTDESTIIAWNDSTQPGTVALDGASGALLWTSPNLFSTSLARDLYGQLYQDPLRYPEGTPNAHTGGSPEILTIDENNSARTTFRVNARTGEYTCEYSATSDTFGVQFLATAGGSYDLMFASAAGEMSRLSGEDCATVVWARPLSDRWSVPIPDVNEDGQVDVLAEPSYYDATVRVLDGATGSDIWSQPYGAFDVLGGQVVEDDLGLGVIVSAQLSSAGGVRRYNAFTGNVVWDCDPSYNNNTALGLLRRSDGQTVLSGWRHQNQAVAFDARTGDLLWDNVPIDDADFVGVGVPDMTGDGSDDLLVLTNGAFHLVDGRTGAEQPWFPAVVGGTGAYDPTGPACPSDWVPAFELADTLPAAACTSVDLSPDESTLYACVNFGPSNDNGYRWFDVNMLTWQGDCHVPGVTWAGKVSHDGNGVWTSRYYGGYVSLLNPGDCTIEQNLDVGNWTDDLLFDDDRHYLFVGENDPGIGASGSVQVVDTWQDPPSAVCSVPLNGEPGRLARASGDPFVYVVTRNSGTETLYKINVDACAVEGTLSLPGVGDSGISVAPRGDRIYVPHESADDVIVVDSVTLTIVDDYNLLSPQGFFVAPTGSFALASRGGIAGDGTISVFDIGSRTIRQELSVVGNPSNRRPAWSAYGDSAYFPLLGTSTEDGGVAVLKVVNTDCNTNSIPDECERDFDLDGVIDDCDDDIDNDGVPNEADVCVYTPPGVLVDDQGRPFGDLDHDCDADLADYALFQQGFTGAS